jgi:hypothetical protein
MRLEEPWASDDDRTTFKQQLLARSNLSEGIAMTRVRVWLDSVYARDTEDVTGSDTFFIAGFITDGETIEPFMTTPVEINSGQRRNLRGGRPGNLFFDADVPKNRSIRMVWQAFDRDGPQGSDWPEQRAQFAALSLTISGALQLVPNPYTIAASYLLPITAAATIVLIEADKDDNLGAFTADYPVEALPKNETVAQYWTFSKSAVPWWSDWSYVVRYSIAKGVVPADAGF